MRRVMVVVATLAGMMLFLGGCHRKEARRKPSPRTPGSVQILGASLLVTTEKRGTATFTIVLGKVPTADVVIPLASSRPAEGMPGADQLAFTPANWNIPQNVVVTGVDDPVADGTQFYAILVGPAVSDDPHYES